jgi:hypothetical protein
MVMPEGVILYYLIAESTSLIRSTRQLVYSASTKTARCTSRTTTASYPMSELDPRIVNVRVFLVPAASPANTTPPSSGINRKGSAPQPPVNPLPSLQQFA